MKLYIPEINDEIRLLEDWIFDLHAEERNKSLGSINDHYLFYHFGGKWLDRKDVPEMRPIDYEVKYPNYSDFIRYERHWEKHQEACKIAEQNCEAYVKYENDTKEWRSKAEPCGKELITVTIPAGTVLKIDRIYIRRGLSEYSSLTFSTHDLGNTELINPYRAKSKKKLSSIRFWAKLADCNNINCERVI